MTFQPPPPPPGQPPYGGQPNQGGQPQYGAPPPPPAPAGPPPPAQQWGPPPQAPQQPAYNPPPAPPAYGQAPMGAPGYGAAKPAFDPKSINQMDWGILAAGFLAFIFSFFDYYTASAGAGGFSISVSASAWHGFFGWFAALVALVSAALLAAELFGTNIKLPIPTRLAVAGGFAIATLCVILALLIFPDGGYSGDGVSEGRGFGYWVSLIVIIAGLVLSVLRLKATGGSLPWEKGQSAPPPPPPGYGPPPPGYGPQ